jgi:hypothetical protein
MGNYQGEESIRRGWIEEAALADEFFLNGEEADAAQRTQRTRRNLEL